MIASNPPRSSRTEPKPSLASFQSNGLIRLAETVTVLLWPAWILAFALSIIGVWLTDKAFSWGAVGVQRVVVQSVEEIAYGMLRTQRSYANQRFSIIVKDVQDRKLIRPDMNFQASGDMPAIRISAAEAELKNARVKVEGDLMTQQASAATVSADFNEAKTKAQIDEQHSGNTL